VAALTISLWSQETAAARIALARARLAADDPAAARRELDRALVLDPQSAEALALVALLESDDLR
jgi:Tfp pilus assembly protein PilF